MADQSDLASWAERRRDIRVPTRGRAILKAHTTSIYGTLDNVSQSGALLTTLRRLEDRACEVRLANGSGAATARAVRVEPVGETDRWRVAIAFETIDPGMREAIEASIASAYVASRRRALLVIDDHAGRRAELIRRLAEQSMTPLIPRTPLEAMDLLNRPSLHLGVCLFAPGLGVSSNDLVRVLAESFPWVTTAEISDDVELTVARAMVAWSSSPVGRLGASPG